MRCNRSKSLFSIGRHPVSRANYWPTLRKDLTEEILGKDRSNRKSKGDDGDGMDYIGGRRRSISASPFSSGSATSTDDSRGSSVRGEDKYYHSQQSPSILRKEIGTRKRRRSLTSSERSLSSEPSEREARPISRDQERNTRARRGLLSPDERGRRRSRSREGRKRGRSRSRTRSVHRGHTTRVSRSVTPHRPTRQDAWFDSPRERGHYDREIEHIGRRNRSDQTRHDSYDERGRNNGRREEESRKENQTRPPPKERSLSPFSKRLALTQAMNMGR